MKILHLFRQVPEDRAIEMVGFQGLDHEITIVYLRENPGMDAPLPGRVFALQEGHEASVDADDRPGRIGYRDLLKLIMENERIFCW